MGTLILIAIPLVIWAVRVWYESRHPEKYGPRLFSVCGKPEKAKKER